MVHFFTCLGASHLTVRLLAVAWSKRRLLTASGGVEREALEGTLSYFFKAGEPW